jgi:hypothetical protein
MILANHGIISSSGGLPPSTLLTDLYAVYNAENNANDSFGTNNGTVQGGLTYAAGINGNSFVFNGTNAYVSLPNNSLNPGGDFSFSFWVKFNSVAPIYINLIENYYAPSPSNRYGYNIYLQSGKIVFATYNGSVTNSVQATSSLSINQWYNIVLSKKTSNVPKLYINGVIDNFSYFSGNISNNLVYNSLCKSLLGVDYDTSYNSFLNGSLDAIALWDKELTQTEITELQTKFYPF